MWALDLGDKLYELDNAPWFARDLALGDIVKCEVVGDTLPRILEVVKPSGNWTVRVFVPDSPNQEAVKREIMDFVAGAGCKYEGFGKQKGLIAVTIPSDVDLGNVLAQLRAYQLQEKAFWESGNF